MNLYPTCNVCNSDTYLAVKKDGYELCECSKCKLVFVNPMPTNDDLNKLYSSETGYQKHKTLVKKISKEQSDNYSKIIHYLKKSQNCNGSRLLDIGCSSGDFLVLAKEAGFSVEGIELNEATASVARERGFKIYSGRLSDYDLSEGQFDVVHLGDVIEHVQNPHEFIGDINKLLKPNGFLVITTPNMRCFWSESTRVLYDYFGIPWSVATPPHHLYQFSDYNLDLLIDNLGLSLSARWYNHLPNLIYELGSLHLLQAWKKDKNVKNGLRLFFGFSAYTIIFIINKSTKFIRTKDMGMVSVYCKK